MTAPAARVPVRALPPERPLAMVRQPVSKRRRRLRAGSTWRTALATGCGRLLVLAATIALTAYGVSEMLGVMQPGGITLLQWVFLGLFAVNFTWVSFAGVQAVVGFLRGLWLDGLALARQEPDAPPEITTAILVPVYNEDPRQIAAMIETLRPALAARAAGRFAVFVLSDSTDPDVWIREEAVFADMGAGAPDPCPLYYRHRRSNAERKPGNIADWVQRFGAGFDAMLILDADSVMSADTVLAMARRLEADPGLGLLQTLPGIAGARSFYARLQQFANRCYGRIFGDGLAAWHGRGSNFWGHNAIIRTRAFACAAGLPKLKGHPPLGGPVLSHDFIEAAFLRRAGWGVRMDTDLGGSFEEAPPSLSDVMIRDRRWAQGNLQHVRFLFARGLALTTRLHLFSGIMAYLSAILWFALFVSGLVVAVQAALTRPEYFAEPSLFPTWPVFDSERAIKLFIVSMTVVLSPKILGWMAIMLRPRQMARFGGPIAVTASVLTETACSALYAPLMMTGQARIVWHVLTGQDSGWQPQRRGDGRVRLRDAIRSQWPNMAFGLTLAGLAHMLNPDLFWWILPVTAGLILAVPLSWLSGSRILGTLLRLPMLLRTPEESRRFRPDILARVESRKDEIAMPEGGALQMLAADPLLRAWHLGQVPAAEGGNAPFDPALVIAREKASRSRDLGALQAWLNRAETMAFLHDRSLVEGLAPAEPEATASDAAGRGTGALAPAPQPKGENDPVAAEDAPLATPLAPDDRDLPPPAGAEAP